MSVNLPYLDRIWRVRSVLVLDEPVAPAEAFERLDPLFQTDGTDVSINGDTLTYKKTNPNAQDKLATFTRGTLRITQEESHSKLSYDVSSTALFLCFLAPLLFLAFSQLAVVLNTLDPPDVEDARGADADDDDDEPKPLHWIDQALGAPEPESKEDKEEDEEDEEDEKHSPVAAYALAGIFALIYAVGRVLEPWLIKRTFRKALTTDFGNNAGEASAAAPATVRVVPTMDQRETGRKT